MYSNGTLLKLKMGLKEFEATDLYCLMRVFSVLLREAHKKTDAL
jgi:hypothetical protein